MPVESLNFIQFLLGTVKEYSSLCSSHDVVGTDSFSLYMDAPLVQKYFVVDNQLLRKDFEGDDWFRESRYWT